MTVFVKQTQGKLTLYSCIKDFGKRSPNKFVKEIKKKHELDIVKYFRIHAKSFPGMQDKEIIDIISKGPKLKVEIY